MVKNNKTTTWVIVGIILVGLLAGSQLGLFSITGSETMSRSFSSPADPGSTVTVTYSVSGASGKWGASVEDVLNCGSHGSQEKKFVVLSEEGTTKTIQYNLPNVEDFTCSFQGDYQFGSTSIKNFPSQNIKTRVTTVSHDSYQCYNNDVYWYDSKSQREDKKEECGQAGCSSGECNICAIDVDYDTDCDGDISRNELGLVISKWINNQVSRSELGQVIQAWAS